MPDLTQPVADILHEIQTQFLTPVLQPEILTGTGNLPRFILADGGPIYGGVFSVRDIPPYLGRTQTDEPEYFEQLLGLRFVSIFKNNAQLTTRVDSLHREVSVVSFTNLAYTTVIYDVLPGCSFTFAYLRIFLT